MKANKNISVSGVENAGATSPLRTDIALGMGFNVTRLLHGVVQKINYIFSSGPQQMALLDAAPGQIAVLDAQGNIVAVNEAWKKLVHGLHTKQCNGHTGDNYLAVWRNAAAEYAGVAQQMIAGITGVINGLQKEFVFEYPCPLAPQNTWYQARVSPVKLGKARGAVVMHFNITERKLAEEKIHRSEANLTAIIENTGAGVFSIDRQLRYITFNNMHAAHVKEYFKIEINPGDSIVAPLEKIDPAEALAWKEAYAEAFTGKPLMFVKDYSKPGKPLFISFSINPILENQTVTGLSCLARDITRKRLAEDELRASEQRYRHISQNPILGIIWLSPQGKVLNANQSFCNMLGYNSIDLIDKHFYTYTHPDDVAVQQGIIEQFVAGELSSWGTEKRYITKSGETMWGKAILYPVKNDRGQVKYVIGVMHDITKTKNMEAQLVTLNESLENKIKERTAELERANSELESFNYTVSHNLQAPLRVVNGYSKLMMKDYGDRLDEKGKEHLEVINKMVHRMSQLVKDLLSFSRNSKTPVVRREVNMNELVHAITDEIQVAGTSANYHLHIQNLPPAFCDPALIKQVWANLISNAIKYSKNKQAPLIEVGSMLLNDQQTYYVKDNGAGFDMQYAGKLFAAFQRLHKQEEFEGTGVGLATVQRIIARHGGHVWAEAKINEGATFFFTLPPYGASTAGLESACRPVNPT